MIGSGHILSLLFEPDSKANRMLRIPAATFVFSDLLNIVEPGEPCCLPFTASLGLFNSRG